MKAKLTFVAISYIVTDPCAGCRKRELCEQPSECPFYRECREENPFMPFNPKE